MKGWVDIPGFEGRYMINPEGYVKNVNGKLLKRTAHQSGVLYVHLYKGDGKCHQRSIPKLMAEVFLGGVPDGYVTCCMNGDNNDCRVENIGIVLKSKWRDSANHCNRKPIAKVDDEGNVLKVYASATEAAEANFMSPSAVTWHAKGKYKGGGYSFRYVERKP